VYFQAVQDIQIGTRVSRAQYQYTLVGTDAGQVSASAAKLTDQLRKSTVLRDVASEAQEGGLQVMVNVDRETAGRLGVSMQAINDTLNSAFGQRQVSTIYGQSNQYRVILEALPKYQQDPASLGKLYVNGNNNAGTTNSSINNGSNTGINAGSANTTVIPNSNASPQVPLSAIATFTRTTAP